MQIIYKLKHNYYELIVAKTINNSDILFNKIKDKLSYVEIENYNSIKNEKRKCEWLAVRILFFEMNDKHYEIKYYKYGKPFVENNYCISISHSNGVVAVIKTKNNNKGIDIEKISERIYRIAYKFLNKKENHLICKNNKLKYLYLNWCAKETMYKIYSKGSLDFKKNLNVEIKNIEQQGTINCEIIKNQFNCQYTLNYKFLDVKKKNDFLLVWYSGI